LDYPLVRFVFTCVLGYGVGGGRISVRKSLASGIRKRAHFKNGYAILGVDIVPVFLTPPGGGSGGGKNGRFLVKKHGYRGGFGVLLGGFGDNDVYGRHKSWEWTYISGNGIAGSSFVYVCNFWYYDSFEILPHRQCWEQERTTCSGGYPSATCSAFLHYCDGVV
jgi:hypothetical protein